MIQWLWAHGRENRMPVTKNKTPDIFLQPLRIMTKYNTKFQINEKVEWISSPLEFLPEFKNKSKTI
jgi:hypothetical protein